MSPYTLDVPNGENPPTVYTLHITMSDDSDAVVPMVQNENGKSIFQIDPSNYQQTGAEDTIFTAQIGVQIEPASGILLPLEFDISSHTYLQGICRQMNLCEPPFPSSMEPKETGYENCDIAANSCMREGSTQPMPCSQIDNLLGDTDMQCIYFDEELQITRGVVYFSPGTVAKLNELTPEERANKVKTMSTSGLYHQDAFESLFHSPLYTLFTPQSNGLENFSFQLSLNALLDAFNQ